MNEMTITIENGFLMKMDHNSSKIDGYTTNYNFFVGPKAKWGRRINTEQTVKKKSAN